MRVSKVIDILLDNPLYIIGLSIFFIVLYLLWTGKTFEQMQRERYQRRADYYAKLVKQEGFGHGQAIGGGTGGSGAAYQQIGFQDINEADLIYEKKKEGFGGGGHGAALSGRTGGSGAAYQEDDFTNMTDKDKDQLKEAFQGIGPAGDVTGIPETTDVSGPADASLKQPREPYNLLKQLPPAPRGSISCLTAACCSETDFEQRTNQTGNFLQRTNNYKREFPDSCSAPLTELNLAFYKNAFLSKT